MKHVCLLHHFFLSKHSLSLQARLTKKGNDRHAGEGSDGGQDDLRDG
jgi:hypothetical protein